MIEEEADALDQINDTLSALSAENKKEISDVFIAIMEALDDMRENFGYYPAPEELELLDQAVEKPEEDEMVQLNFPLYDKDDIESPYDFIIAYAFDGEYVMDMSVQYAWETDLDLEDLDFEEDDF